MQLCNEHNVSLAPSKEYFHSMKLAFHRLDELLLLFLKLEASSGRNFLQKILQISYKITDLISKSEEALKFLARA
jgi:hypothetical protein